MSGNVAEITLYYIAQGDDPDHGKFTCMPIYGGNFYSPKEQCNIEDEYPEEPNGFRLMIKA